MKQFHKLFKKNREINSLPDQLVNQAVTTGFTFNIMCVGETGLGMLFVY